MNSMKSLTEALSGIFSRAAGFVKAKKNQAAESDEARPVIPEVPKVPGVSAAEAPKKPVELTQQAEQLETDESAEKSEPAEPAEPQTFKVPEHQELTEVPSVDEMVNKVRAVQIGVSRASKFTEEERLYIVSMIAHYYSNEEIKQEIRTRFQKSIDNALIYQYKKTPRWAPVIKKLREEYLIDIPSSPCSHKRVRLERLDRIYNRAVKTGDVKSQIGATAQSWKEMGGEKTENTTNVFWNNPVYQQLNTLSNKELLKRQQEATKMLISKEENNESDRPGGTPIEEISGQ